MNDNTDTGETNLQQLLANMKPKLLDDQFVFCSFPNGQYGDYPNLAPIASMLEDEGLTLVISKLKADQFKVDNQNLFRCITLDIHSSLDAVGLTAAFAKALSEQSISANVIAGFYHDHIFISEQDADKAMKALETLSERHR